MSRTDAPRPIHAGVFDTVTEADAAVTALLAAGYDTARLSVVCSEESVREHFAHLHDTVPDAEPSAEEPSGSHTAEAAAAGGAIGLSLGGLAAVTGLVATGGVGLVAAGAVLGAGVFGSFVGAMLTRGVEAEAADFYDQQLRRGQILVVVEGPHPGETGVPPLSVADAALRGAGAIPFGLRDG